MVWENHPASPARAGMYPRLSGRGLDRYGFPRTRGDVPQRHMAGLDRVLLPPHARGCTRRRRVSQGAVAASPARAGMYRRPGYARGGLASFPRTRGDVPSAVGSELTINSLPPHARGCTSRISLHLSFELASPARAGMYLDRDVLALQMAGFPRTRGDVPRHYALRPAPRELPPHARGCTPSRPTSGMPSPASPARAGMYQSLVCRPRIVSVLPPHARGCTLDFKSLADSMIASPARAGMYRATTRSGRRRGSFPRTRGDVPLPAPHPECHRRLPPHARGCTSRSYVGRGSSPCFPRTRGDVPSISNPSPTA